MNPMLARAILLFFRSVFPIAAAAARTHFRGPQLHDAVETMKLAIDQIENKPELSDDEKNEILIYSASRIIGVRAKAPAKTKAL